MADIEQVMTLLDAGIPVTLLLDLLTPPNAAEVFATYTRENRVRAIAGRIEVVRGGWLVVALQIG